MIDNDYKNDSQSSNSQSVFLNEDSSLRSQNQNQQISTSQHLAIDKCGYLISTALKNYSEKDSDNFFEIITQMVSYLDELYEEKNFDIYSILPSIYNSDFNQCLVESINPQLFSPQKINEILALISTLSSYTRNFKFFRKSSIFDIAYNLLQMNEPEVYLECTLLINQYMVIFQTTQFPYNSTEFLQKLSELLNLKNIVKYVAESLKCFILYIDMSQHLSFILDLFNRILQKTQSRHAFNDIIESLVYILNADSNNYSLIFESKIIHTFSFLLPGMVKNENYHIVIQNFFDFLKLAFDKIDWKFQKKTIKAITIDIFSFILEKIEDENVKLNILFISFKYLQSHSNIDDDELPVFTNMLNSGFIGYLLKNFDEQKFEMKKQILTVINKILKTQNQELFSQLLVYDEDANFIVALADFAISINDDVKIQKNFLESLIKLIQIGEINQQKHLITQSPIVHEYINIISDNDDQTIQELVEKLKMYLEF